MTIVERWTAFTDIFLIKLYIKLREKADKLGWENLYEFSQDRISSLEDEISRLTGKRFTT